MMTQVSIDYQLNPRFVPDDIPLWLGSAKDSAVIYDATADDLTLQTQNASAVLTDRIRVESGTNTPFVEIVAGNMRLLDAAADPTAAGELTLNGADLKVYSGGAVRSLTDIASGLANVVEDTTPQLGGALDCQSNAVNNIGNTGTDLSDGSWTLAKAAGQTVFSMDSYSVAATGHSSILLDHSNNDALGSHTAVDQNDELGGLVFRGSNGTSFVNGAMILGVADETFSGSARGSRIEFRAVDNTTTTMDTKWTVEHDGVLTCDSGSLDMNSNPISNVGAAGNDWTQNALALAGGSASQIMSITTTGASAQSSFRLILPASSTGTASVIFKQGDGSGDANNQQYILAYGGVGTDYLYLSSANSDGASTAADIWRVPDGQTTIDANTTWDDNIFDHYDDAVVLSPYRDGMLSLAQRKRELIEMGVLRQYEDGWVGYNDQRMAALLAGGIYQNRARLDHYRLATERALEDFQGRLSRQSQLIGNLSKQISTTKADLAALKR